LFASKMSKAGFIDKVCEALADEFLAQTAAFDVSLMRGVHHNVWLNVFGAVEGSKVSWVPAMQALVGCVACQIVPFSRHRHMWRHMRRRKQRRSTCSDTHMIHAHLRVVRRVVVMPRWVGLHKVRNNV